MIELKHISKKFGERNILSDVSSVFEKGQVNLVIGGSGSGKTSSKAGLKPAIYGGPYQ